MLMSSNIDIKRLSKEERLQLLEAIWDSLDPDDVPVTDAQREELDRRIGDLESDTSLGIPWDEVQRQIRGRRE